MHRLKCSCLLLDASSQLIINRATNLRSIGTTSVLRDVRFRLRNKLPWNPTSAGPLTDGPDFTYLDSNKPTPMNKGQMERLMKQQKLAQTVLKLNAEIQFAIDQDRQNQLEEAASKQKILSAKLKPKGQVKSEKQ